MSTDKEFTNYEWKRKMPEDHFPLVNLNLVSRMELFDRSFIEIKQS